VLDLVTLRGLLAHRSDQWSSRWEPSCTGPGRIRGWPGLSSTATYARPSICYTGPHRTPRSWSWPVTCAGPRNGAGPAGRRVRPRAIRRGGAALRRPGPGHGRAGRGQRRAPGARIGRG
jgi:hypothetical protein